jgi:type II secretory ATPase GspE/PulE/Tfp pilus assembly ATPase PilB-like protein
VLSDPMIDKLQLKQVLIGVIGGVMLCRPVCPHCSCPQDLDATALRALRRVGFDVLTTANWVQGKGCDTCHGTGMVSSYAARIPIVEAIYVDRTLAAFCSTMPDKAKLLYELEERGFRSYLQQCLDLAMQGRTTIQEALRLGLSRRADL